MNRVERVARAISLAQTQTEDMWQAFLPESRAAVKAMRPIRTGDINYALGRAADAKETPMHGLVRSFWQSMIDAALKEKS